MNLETLTTACWGVSITILLFQIFINTRKNWVFKFNGKEYFLLPKELELDEAAGKIAGQVFGVVFFCLGAYAFIAQNTLMLNATALATLLSVCYSLGAGPRVFWVSADSLKAPWHKVVKLKEIESVHFDENVMELQLSLNRKMGIELQPYQEGVGKRTVMKLTEKITART